jgi:hypothetical protein
MSNPPDLNDPILLVRLQQLHRMGQQWCTDEDFQVIHANDKDWAADEMFKGGIHTNMYTVHGSLRNADPTRKDQKVMMPIGFTDWPPPAVIDGKPFGVDGAMQALATMWTKAYPDHTPAAMSHISEAWMARGGLKDKPKGWTPSQDPGRVEVVIVATSTIDQRISHSYRPIIRNKADKVTSLGKDFGRQYVPGKPVDPRSIYDLAILAFFTGYLNLRFLQRGTTGE